MTGYRGQTPLAQQASQGSNASWQQADNGKQAKPTSVISCTTNGRTDDLLAVIESDIIPRLMLVHRGTGLARNVTQENSGPIDAATCATFTRMVQHAPLEELLGFVRQLAADGFSARTILIDLCAPAARKLGDLWVEDEVDFIAVTLGLSRLQQLVHEFMLSYHTGENAPTDSRALIVPTPGEQHSFGATIAAQLFRDSGWNVDGGLAVSSDELTNIVSREAYDVVGFSQSSDLLVGNLASAINVVRKGTRAKSVKVIVGGRFAAERPELCSAVGADFFVKDTSEAIEYSGRLLRQLNQVTA